MQAPTLPTPTMPTLSNQHQTTSDVERSWAVGDGRVAPAHCRPIDAFHPRLVLAPRHSTASTLRYFTTPASLSLSVHKLRKVAVVGCLAPCTSLSCTRAVCRRAVTRE
ncbi:hypothetical protein C0Q70_09782 [Pomacea canaliculata]|uniref:Uncharacterized protein n=1 Tax=Pomacea canaliculata TaxID=400727 RepID=A0A2T7PAR3_POMCA|nr:hypothetical protein C0Q70_09782 [Pomacea canaliculata]